MNQQYKAPRLLSIIGAVVVAIVSTFLFVGSVTAAVPQYQLLSDINTTLSQDNNQFVGTLLFNELGVIPENIVVSNYSQNRAAEKGDSLLWQGGSTLQATSPSGNTNLVSNNAQYFFTNIGTYTFRNPSNTSQQFSVSVVDYPRAQISLSVDRDQFGVVLSEESFTLSGEKTVRMNITKPSTSYPARNETITVTSTSSAGNFTESFDFVLPKYETFNLGAAGNKSVVVGLGSTAEAGTFVVDNDGNSDYTVTVTKTGNASSFLDIVSNFQLFRDTTNQFPVTVRIPSTANIGTYTSEVVVRSADTQESFFVRVNVQDTEPPVIQNITYSESELGINNVISVLLEDRESASEGTVTWTNNTRNLSFDNGVWVFEEVFTDRDPYRFTFCLSDDNNNTACRNETKQFDRLDLFNQTGGARSFSSTRTGAWGRVELFNITREVLDTPIAVRLDDFTTSFDTTNYTRSVIGNLYTVRIVDGDGSFKRFNNLNSTVLVESPGMIYLEVRGSEELLARDLDRASFSGNLMYDTPDYYEDLRPQSFEGDTVKYSLPEDFEIAWGTGGTIECRIVDTGSLDTSYGDCDLRIPAEDLSKDTIVPISLSERALLENRTAVVTKDFEDKLALRNALVGIGFGLVFVISLVLWFLVYIKPRLLYLSR